MPSRSLHFCHHWNSARKGARAQCIEESVWSRSFAMAGMRRATDLLRRVVVSSRQCAPAFGRSMYGTSRIVGSRESLFLRSDRDLAPAAGVFQALNMKIAVKHLHSDSGLGVPIVSDPQAKTALNALLAANWSKIPDEIKDEVEAVLTKGVADAAVLSTVWSSAQACEKFAGTLIALRMELDDMSGGTGESVGKISETLVKAIESAYSKYTSYLDAIGEDEDFLNKKVENDIGSILIQIKQRCNGLDPKWGKITLLGTSGISGSYIELRSRVHDS